MSDSHSYWSELAALALVGVERRPAVPPPPPGPLAAAIGAGEPDPAAALLAAAAAASAFVRAGSLPPAAPAAPVPPAPADDLPPCGPRSAGHLRALLGRAHRAALPEWLAALAASGRRAPDEALPALLELARAERPLRGAVAGAIGARGRWLAALNPDWSFAAGQGDAQDEGALEQLWQTGTRAARLQLIEALRPARPALARKLVESTWAAEKADDRAALVAALGPALADADEPFLEAALDDRSKEVRAAAAALLRRLPGSRLARRMTDRALGLLHIGHGPPGVLQLLRRAPGPRRLDVSLPDACDKALQRDGVDPRPPRGTGERAWWLSEIVARTPPAAWCAAWSLTPSAILELPVAAEWRDLLVAAWSAAAYQYGDLAWAVALAELGVREGRGGLEISLLAILPQERREPLLARLLDGGRSPLTGEHVALAALRAAPAPWGRGLSRAVLGSLARRFERLDEAARADWHLRAALEEFALAIPPDMAEEAVAALPPQLAESPYWSDAIQAFADRLRLRRDMHAALRSGS